ncbi:hypothetical protein DEO72_LG2g3892 [Vigna unguiculata]|uniref:Uncharacterized protein n=1 Tax=Vigna unguiculata TaxID=3917 RepID=A0A4D6L4Z4_VIGUN|nr:hypothetical protein DEO72_LG2g3892 [Vigna unguiculata]
MAIVMTKSGAEGFPTMITNWRRVRLCPVSTRTQALSLVASPLLRSVYRCVCSFQCWKMTAVVRAGYKSEDEDW